MPDTLMVSLLFYVALGKHFHCLSDTIPRSSLAYEFLKGIQLDLGLYFPKPIMVVIPVAMFPEIGS